MKFQTLIRTAKMAMAAMVVGSTLVLGSGGAAHASEAPLSIAQDDLVVTSANITASGNVLMNDVNGATMVPIALPVHGGLLWQPNGTFTYQPAPDYVGTDTFTYMLADRVGQQSATLGTVVITVMPTEAQLAYPVYGDALTGLMVAMHDLANQMKATSREARVAARASDLSAIQAQAARVRLSAQQALAAGTVQGAMQIAGGLQYANTGLKYANAVLAMPVPQASKPQTDTGKIPPHCQVGTFNRGDLRCMP